MKTNLALIAVIVVGLCVLQRGCVRGRIIEGMRDRQQERQQERRDRRNDNNRRRFRIRKLEVPPDPMPTPALEPQPLPEPTTQPSQEGDSTATKVPARRATPKSATSPSNPTGGTKTSPPAKLDRLVLHTVANCSLCKEWIANESELYSGRCDVSIIADDLDPDIELKAKYPWFEIHYSIGGVGEPHTWAI